MWQLSDIQVVKNFAPKELCKQLIDEFAHEGTYETINLNHPKFETPNLQNQMNAKTHWTETVQLIFNAMKAKWEELGGVKTTWDDPKIRPLVIHYPKGGGFFGKHEHSLEPQKFGLILSLTDGPATLFHFPEGDLQTHRETGDLTIFRYDIPHSVPMVEPGEPLEFLRPTGRWVAILPYF